MINIYIFKGGGKGREGKGSQASIVTYEEAAEITDLGAYWGSLEEWVNDLKEHFIKHLTLRSADYIFHP